MAMSALGTAVFPGSRGLQETPTWLSLMPLNVVFLPQAHPLGHPLSTSGFSMVSPIHEAFAGAPSLPRSECRVIVQMGRALQKPSSGEL